MSETKPEISIIMPVYNGQDDIGHMLDSIRAQTLKEWERIVVDDHSSDATCDIVREYAAHDSRIRLLELNQNLGPGPAKNLALEQIRGSYVAFCDADDSVEPQMYDTMLRQLDKGTDVIVCGMVRDVYNTEGRLVRSTPAAAHARVCTTAQECAAAVPELDGDRVFSYAWNKLYRSEIIRKYTVRFSEKKFGEDFDFNIDFFRHVSVMKVLEDVFYHYVKKNDTSLTERYIPEFYEINRDRFDRLIDYLTEKSAYTPEVRRSVMTAYVRHVLMAVARLYDPRGKYTRADRRERVKRMMTDELSKTAAREAGTESRGGKLCNAVFRSGNIPLLLLFGRVLWLLQTRGKKLFEMVNRH